MPGSRPLVGLLALALAGGCIEFERGPMTDGGPATPDSTSEPPAPSVACDPLSQDCPEGQACALFGQDFLCIEVAIFGVAGDACMAPAECGPGLACVPSAYLTSCDGGSCCSSLCDLDDQGAECLTGDTCVAIYDGPDTPFELQDYGVCKLAE